MAVFRSVDQIVTGPGTLDRLGELAAPLGRRALVVTGTHALRAAGVTHRVRSILDAAGVEHRLFEEIGGEPTGDQVDAGRRLCRSENCELVIGIGGGSPMDAAKAVAALAHADRPAAAYVRGRSADAETPLPCIAVPTTSGTGAEVTPNAVVSDPAGPLKASIRGRGVRPRVALVDPDLTLSCPPGVTAASGLDALTQAVESYVSIHATPLTDALALHAAQLLLRHLPAAFRDGADRAARRACAHGSLLAGLALANARLGVVHGIAHPLGVRYHIPHGRCCGVLLPASVRLNRAFAPDKYARLDRAAGGDLADVVEQMLDAFGVPRTFAEFDIPEDDFPAIARESMPSGSLKANPKKITEDDVLTLLRAVAAPAGV
jgi:alcohol dehydrogenase class IV